MMELIAARTGALGYKTPLFPQASFITPAHSFQPCSGVISYPLCWLHPASMHCFVLDALSWSLNALTRKSVVRVALHLF